MSRSGNPVPIWFFIFSIACAVLVSSGSLSAHPHCLAAAKAAALKTGVPADVIVQAAHRHGVKAHPWMVSIDDDHQKFANVEAARKTLFFRFLRGERRFRLGCFNIDYAASSHAFASIDEMFDAEISALWLARELSRLKAIHQTWSAALGAYHARDMQFAAGNAAPQRSRTAIHEVRI